MVRQSAAAKTWGSPFRDIAEEEARSAVYGGIVGTMLDELETRLADPDAQRNVYETSADGIHHMSVAAGYVSLLMGLAVTAWIIYYCFS